MQRSRRGCSSAAAACALAVWVAVAPGVAGAEAPAAPSVKWQAPPGCPDGAAVAERLRAVLEGELAAVARDWQLQGSISRSARAWELVLELREPGAAPGSLALERVLSAPRCQDLVDAAAVAIAIALGDARAADADATQAPAPPARLEPSPSEPPPAPALADAAAPTSSAPAGRQRSLELSLEALLDSVNGAAAGAGVSLGAGLGALGFDLHATWLPAHRKQIGPAQSVDLSLLAAGVRACHRVVGSAQGFGLAACAAFELGRYGADSRGLIAASSTRDLWLAPSLGLDLRARLLGHLAARSRLELLLPLKRQLYRVDLVQPVHEIPALTVRWSVGVAGDVALP